MEGLGVEAVFGGAVLLAVLGLLLSGKLRLEREVLDRDKIISLKDQTIEAQAQTIATLTTQSEVTNHFLADIRHAAYAPERGHDGT
jgi:hypothetical protein